MNVKINQSLQNLGQALERLEEATQVSGHDSLKVDGTIQRFEFTFELCWKTIKRILEVYRNNLKNREFDKEAAQFFASGASDHCLWQGASEDQKNAAKPTSSKTDSSGCFGIEGILVNTPRETIARAFQLNWIKNEKLWLSMLEDRNLTSHIYSETEANQIFDRIHDLYVGELKNLFQLLKKRRDSSYDGSK